MTDTKISAEIAAGPLDGSELFPIVQGGNNRKATISQIDRVTGSGTPDTLPKWTASTTLGDSSVTDDGSLVTVGNPVLVKPPLVYLSDELLSNPSFVADDTGWTITGSTTWSPGQFLTDYEGGDDPTVSTAFDTVAGHAYLVTYDFAITGDLSQFYFNNNTGINAPQVGPTRSFMFVADFTGTDTVTFDFWDYNTGATRTITRASVREIAIPINPIDVLGPDGQPYLSVDPLTGTLTAGGGDQYDEFSGPIITSPTGAGLTIKGGADPGVGPANVYVFGNNALYGDNTGGGVQISGGQAAGNGQGGYVALQAGYSPNGQGGPLIINAGFCGTGDGGSINMAAGDSGGSGDGGIIELRAGTSGSGTGGDIVFVPASNGFLQIYNLPLTNPGSGIGPKIWQRDDGALMMAGDTTTQQEFRYGFREQFLTTDYAIVPADAGTLFTNYTATGDITFTLPAAGGTGLQIQFRFCVVATHKITITVPFGTYINNGTTLAKTILSSSSPASFVTLMSVGGSSYVVESITGSWTLT